MTTSSAPPRSVVAVPKVAPMPEERPAVTTRFRVRAAFGTHKLYVTAGLRADGSVGEVFARIDKEGSTMRAMLDAWCIMVSVALQHGVSLREIADKFVGRTFEPRGPVEPSEWGEARSVLDLIARYLLDVDGRVVKT